MEGVAPLSSLYGERPLRGKRKEMGKGRLIQGRNLLDLFHPISFVGGKGGERERGGKKVDGLFKFSLNCFCHLALGSKRGREGGEREKKRVVIKK